MHCKKEKDREMHVREENIKCEIEYREIHVRHVNLVWRLEIEVWNWEQQTTTIGETGGQNHTIAITNYQQYMHHNYNTPHQYNKKEQKEKPQPQLSK